MATVQTQQIREMERNYKDDGSSLRMNRLKIRENELNEIEDHTSRSTTTMNKYPQVGKTGIDAVHEKLPTDGLYHEIIVICYMCKLMTEI